jgi:hypothetical protein
MKLATSAKSVTELLPNTANPALTTSLEVGETDWSQICFIVRTATSVIANQRLASSIQITLLCLGIVAGRRLELTLLISIQSGENKTAFSRTWLVGNSCETSLYISHRHQESEECV